MLNNVPMELRDQSLSTTLDRLLVRAGVLTARITPDEPMEYHWAWGVFFRKFVTFFLMFAMVQGIFFDVKNAYAQQPFAKSSSGDAAVYGNQRVMGSGESDLTRNNLGSVLLRSKSGRTTNQSFDMSHGSAVVWGRYLPEVGRARIDVTYMEKNPVTGDVQLVEKVVGPEDFERAPVDKLPDNGIRKYFTNKAGEKFNPLFQFASSRNGWGGGNNQLYDISFGAMTAAMGLVAKRYNANRGYAMFGHFWHRESDGEQCCCKVLGSCICDNPWYQIDAGVKGSWHVLTSMDNSPGAATQSFYHIRGSDSGGTTANTAPTNRCITDPGLIPSVPSPLVANGLGEKSDPRHGFDELGTATWENEYDRDACVVRGSMNLVSPTAGADFDNQDYHYWKHRKCFGCGLPFILVVIIAIIVVVITYGAGAALMAGATAGAGTTFGAAAATAFSGAMASGAALTAGLVAGGLMTLAHLVNGGSLTDQVSMDAAGSMILGAAIGGFLGGTGFMQMIFDSVNQTLASAANANQLFSSDAILGSSAAELQSTTGVVSSGMVDALKPIAALNQTTEWAFTSSSNSFLDLHFSFAGSDIFTLNMVESATSFGAAIANDESGQATDVVTGYGKGFLTGMGMTEAEALALFPNLPTNTFPMIYGKWLANPPNTNGDEAEWEYRPEVASCFMDPAIQSSNTAGANNGCLGSASATWSVYRVNRQCNPAAAATASDSCEKRYTQFSDVLMMKMGAVLQTEEQIINNDLSTDRTGTADDEPMIYLPRSGGGRPMMYPGSRGSIPEGPVE